MSDFDPNRDKLTGGLSPVESYDAIRAKIVYEVESEVRARIKTYFAVVAVLVAAMGIVGPSAIVKVFVDPAIDASLNDVKSKLTEASTSITEAKFATQQAVDATNDAAKGAKLATEKIAETEDALAKLESKADEINNKFDNLEKEIESKAAIGKGLTEASAQLLKEQLDELNMQVDALLRGANPGAPVNFRTEQMQIYDDGKVKLDTFKANSSIRVEFIVSYEHDHPTVDDAVKELLALGYFATTRIITPGAKVAPEFEFLDELEPDQWLVLTAPRAGDQTMEIREVLSGLEFKTIEKNSRQPGVYKVIHADWADEHRFMRQQGRPSQMRMPGDR